jgi:hypothetical protein
MALLAALMIGMAKPSRPPLIQKPVFVEPTPIEPTVIRTIPIVRPPPAEVVSAPPKPVTAAAPPPYGREAEPAARKKPPPRDICRGKGKRFINNGRSWRCKR